MRQRNVKNKKEIIAKSPYIVNNPEKFINKWRQLYANENPIYLEIGMGKGHFITEMAKTYPNINFIGIEKYDSIIALALKKLEYETIPNLKMIRMDAKDIGNIFNREISKIFLNFSDPWPKKRHASRRLTSPTFLERYDSLFTGNPLIEMKTDNQNLFEYSLISFNEMGYKIADISLDLHNSNYENNIMTEYEKKFSSLDNRIYYVKAIKTR